MKPLHHFGNKDPMIRYPTRSRVTPEAYREQCVPGEEWRLIDTAFKGERALLFPLEAWHSEP